MAGWILWASMAPGDYGRVAPRAASAQRFNVAECDDDMKLPHADLAVVDRTKVLDYLLNEAHPDNGGKARFFASLGFSREDPERLMKALRDVAEQGEVVSSAESVHGEKYVVDGWLSVHTQESRQWSIRTVWIIDCGKDAPRLVTAYPGKE